MQCSWFTACTPMCVFVSCSSLHFSPWYDQYECVWGTRNHGACCGRLQQHRGLARLTQAQGIGRDMLRVRDPVAGTPDQPLWLQPGWYSPAGLGEKVLHLSPGCLSPPFSWASVCRIKVLISSFVHSFFSLPFTKFLVSWISPIYLINLSASPLFLFWSLLLILFLSYHTYTLPSPPASLSHTHAHKHIQNPWSGVMIEACC